MTPYISASAANVGNVIQNEMPFGRQQVSLNALFHRETYFLGKKSKSRSLRVGNGSDLSGESEHLRQII